MRGPPGSTQVRSLACAPPVWTHHHRVLRRAIRRFFYQITRNQFSVFTQALIFSVRSRTLPLTMAAARKLIPLLDRVLVQKITAPVKSSGGVLLPDSAASKVTGRQGRAGQGGALQCFVPSSLLRFPAVMELPTRARSVRGLCLAVSAALRRSHSPSPSPLTRLLCIQQSA